MIIGEYFDNEIDGKSFSRKAILTKEAGMFHISVVNRTRTASDLDLHRAAWVIDLQTAEDF